MARAGQEIYNPVTTDRIIFRKTREDTNGELLQFDNYHQPGGIGPMSHLHPLQEETFEVVAGIFAITLNGQERILTSGDKVVVPKGVVHYWRNAGTDELYIVTEFRPALHFEELIETSAALAKGGKMDKAGYADANEPGRPDFLQMCATLSYFPGEFYTTAVPIPVQKLIFGTLGPVLRRLFGYPAWIPYT